MSGAATNAKENISEGMFRAMIEHSFDFVLVLGADGSLKYVSPSGRRVLRLEASGTPTENVFARAIHPDDLPLIMQAHHDTLANPDVPQRVPCYRYITSAGEIRYVEAIGTNCMNVPGIEGVVVNIREITERKLAENKLLELNRELETRVNERTAELSAANAQLVEAENSLRAALASEKELHRMKTNFVAMMSHETRTPLQGILSSTELLMEFYERFEPGDRLAALTNIRDATKRMAESMDEILLLSRVESAGYRCNPQPTDVGELCRQIAGDASQAMKERCSVSVQCDALHGDAVLDRALFRHIFSNLLSNAIKFSPPDSRVEFVAKRDGNEIEFSVRDCGSGIPQDDLPRLFQTFARGSNVGETPGSGIGLVIVKRCVDLLLGRIEISSKTGQGTLVNVWLPLSECSISRDGLPVTAD